jgi:CO/xanthine dehydrogenase Mo-binding subunit
LHTSYRKGLHWALEEVQFDSAGVKSLDWSSYPIIRSEDLPDVDIVLLNHPEMPSLGGGEASTVPVAVAIANAIFDAIGVRLREVPLNPKRVLSALRGESASAVRT